MRLLVAGSAARLGIALATALHDRGHIVLLADRFEEIESRRASALWNHWHPHAPALELHDGRLFPQLRPAVAQQDAVVIVGNPRNPTFDIDLAISLADAAVGHARAIPILRITATDGDAGLENGPVALRRGVAQLRDFPDGIPEERTAATLPENDRALRLLTTMRDQICVVLRACECVAAGRLEFEASDLASATILASALDLPPVDLAPETQLDLVDGATLASAIESAVARAWDLGGEVLHVTGGRSARVTLGDLEGQLDGLRSAEDSLLPDESQFSTARATRAPAALRALLLDDQRTRSQLRFSELTWAPRAIERFRRFVVNHSSELALPNLLLA